MGNSVRAFFATLNRHRRFIFTTLGVSGLLDLIKEYFRGRLVNWAVSALGSFGRWLFADNFALLSCFTVIVVICVVILSLAEIHSKPKGSLIYFRRDDPEPIDASSMKWIAAVGCVVALLVGVGAYNYIRSFRADVYRNQGLSIIRFDSINSILIYNRLPESVFVIDILSSSAYGSQSLGLGIEIKPKREANQALGSKEEDLVSIHTMGKTWDEHYRNAFAKYSKCLKMVVFSETDQDFTQMSDFYFSHGELLQFTPGTGVIHYRIGQDDVTYTQTIPIVIIAMVNLKC
jgi:hypothetical protein